MKNLNKIKLLLIFWFSLLYNCKDNISNDNDLIKTEIDSIKDVKFKKASIINEDFIFYNSGQDVLYNCNKTSNKVSKRFFDIDSLKESEILKMEPIKGYSEYFKKILGKDILNCFYYTSYNLSDCSSILYFENEDGTFSSYLFLFDNSGRFKSKLLLSEKNINSPGLYSKKYSEILLNQKTIKVSIINFMVDEYLDEYNFSEIVDSIEIEYSINKNNMLLIKNRDSTRSKVITKH